MHVTLPLFIDAFPHNIRRADNFTAPIKLHSVFLWHKTVRYAVYQLSQLSLPSLQVRELSSNSCIFMDSRAGDH